VRSARQVDDGGSGMRPGVKEIAPPWSRNLLRFRRTAYASPAETRVLVMSAPLLGILGGVVLAACTAGPSVNPASGLIGISKAAGLARVRHKPGCRAT